LIKEKAQLLQQLACVSFSVSYFNYLVTVKTSEFLHSTKNNHSDKRVGENFNYTWSHLTCHFSYFLWLKPTSICFLQKFLYLKLSSGNLEANFLMLEDKRKKLPSLNCITANYLPFKVSFSEKSFLD